MKNFLQIIFILFCVKQVNAQICLGTPTYYNAGAGPVSIVIADFNSDGKKDIVEINASSSNLYIRLGTGIGSFASADSFSTGYTPQGLLSADFNRDGKLDLATANYGSFSGDISILLGTGTGSFSSPVNFSSGFGPYSITGADFNEDGFIDIAVGNWGSSGSSFVSIVLGNGAGAFGNPTSYIIGTGSGSGYAKPSSITNADFNNDGHIDLVTANSSDNTVSVLLGTGAGTFGNITNISVGSNPNTVCSADFNGDGNKDIAVSNYTAYGVAQNICTLLGTGTGNFGAVTGYTLPNDYASSVIPVDYNNDSFTDLAFTYGTYPGIVGILIGNGAGVFSSLTNYALTSTPSTGHLAADDLNGDGNIDLVLSVYWSNQLAVLLNCTTVGIEDFTDNDEKTMVYPNPANNKISIDANDRVDAKLFDFLGKEIINTEEKEIDVSNLNDGIYFIQVKTNQNTYTQKIIVQH